METHWAGDAGDRGCRGQGMQGTGSSSQPSPTDVGQVNKSALGPKLTPRERPLAGTICMPRSQHACPNQLKGSKNSICLHQPVVSHGYGNAAQCWALRHAAPVPQSAWDNQSVPYPPQEAPAEPPSTRLPASTRASPQGSASPQLPPYQEPGITASTQPGGLKVIAEDSQVFASASSTQSN